jgi:hypothetical protein
MTVQHRDFVKRHQTVIAEVTDSRNLDVSDILDFAKTLEENEAPLHHKVEFLESGEQTGLLWVLRVDWQEETLNGKPPPDKEVS